MPLSPSACRVVARLAVLAAVALLGACQVSPQRPYMAGGAPGSPCASALTAERKQTTPEVPDHGTYTLHFVEFDDQGWAFPDSADGGTPSRQIDCAIADLRRKLEHDQANVLSFVYVHGWKHSAAADDRDLRRFRKLLKSRAEAFPDRRVVGIYIGWQGHTVDVWGLDNLTFWGRKNAAAHVAEGRVRELFSRIRGLRAYWNGPRQAAEGDCDAQPGGTDRCRLRTVMIGHSFGGLILFNSAEPYLLEMLSIDRDLPPGAERPRAARARGIADLIVLLNPAFEGSRYEPIFDASRHYVPRDREPPLLVMLTSDADLATKTAFPIARWFNSIFQYPASSDEQSVAMRRTPGHTDRYLTHELCLGQPGCTVADGGASRRYCGGLVLREYPPEPGAALRSQPVVWNVSTEREVIAGHNDIDGPHTMRFIEQVYGDVTGLGVAACGEADDDGEGLPAP